MNPWAKKLSVLTDYQLEIEFENGTIGRFSMKPYLHYPVYQPLLNTDKFKQARVVMGVVTWGDDIDIAPDTLYLESKFPAKDEV